MSESGDRLVGYAVIFGLGFLTAILVYGVQV